MDGGTYRPSSRRSDPNEVAVKDRTGFRGITNGTVRAAPLVGGVQYRKEHHVGSYQ